MIVAYLVACGVVFVAVFHQFTNNDTAAGGGGGGGGGCGGDGGDDDDDDDKKGIISKYKTEFCILIKEQNQR